MQVCDYMADGPHMWFSGPDPQLCSQVANQGVLLTRHIMHQFAKMRVAGASPIFGGGENRIWHMHTQLGYVLCVATMQLHVTHVDI